MKRMRAAAAGKTVVGQAVREALAERPVAVAAEDLTQLRGRTKSRKASRIASRWARAPWPERLALRTMATGSGLEAVNAA